VSQVTAQLWASIAHNGNNLRKHFKSLQCLPKVTHGSCGYTPTLYVQHRLEASPKISVTYTQWCLVSLRPFDDLDLPLLKRLTPNPKESIVVIRDYHQVSNYVDFISVHSRKYRGGESPMMVLVERCLDSKQPSMIISCSSKGESRYWPRQWTSQDAGWRPMYDMVIMRRSKHFKLYSINGHI
jgi:hypothetical protein